MVLSNKTESPRPYQKLLVLIFLMKNEMLTHVNDVHLKRESQTLTMLKRREVKI